MLFGSSMTASVSYVRRPEDSILADNGRCTSLLPPPLQFPGVGACLHKLRVMLNKLIH